jgi:thiol:disulfide interchange protein DsbD
VPEPEAATETQSESGSTDEEAMLDSVVFAEFQSSAQAIRPGGKFLLAVRFDIAGDYRISGSDPGDVGRSTQVKFEVPEGFSVGPVQFPEPQRFDLPGGLVSYGYKGQTAVFAEVTAPSRLSQSRAYRFDVKADWFACKRDCATEELQAWFELVSSPQAPEPRLPRELREYYNAIR